MPHPLALPARALAALAALALSAASLAAQRASGTAARAPSAAASRASASRASASRASAPTRADSAGIRAAALDYIEGWYAGDGDRMQRAVHASLAKRIVTTDPSGQSRLGSTTAAALVADTRSGGGRDTPAARRRTDVRILDVYRNAATVRVDAHGWIDYMHLARVDGEWKIINVLWERRPPAGDAP